ncbi:rifin PIR protein,putative [Plasmodium sp. DRC-Itaito]|nr:rifin PIR protein,putative [Plasmodium sp. DRC-Itaito]
MKLHYFKILLFFILLNILVTSYHVHNKNKASITPHHTRTTTSRVLSESDIQSLNYDNDKDMKNVMQQFDDRTSQRLREYDERMQDKRQKCKEERDKNIQKIIEKDKMEKSLAEKIENGCLRCGCGLGGVAASVGIFGAVAVNELTKAATVAAFEFATKEGIKAGIEAAITQIKGRSFIRGSSLVVELPNIINESNYNTVNGLFDAFMAFVKAKGENCPAYGGTMEHVCNAITTNRNAWLGPAAKAGEQATATKTAAVKIDELTKVATASTQMYSAIGYSVLAILIIVFVMIIIYLVLRYHRKKQKNKKAQYTKLLNQ